MFSELLTAVTTRKSQPWEKVGVASLILKTLLKFKKCGKNWKLNSWITLKLKGQRKMKSTSIGVFCPNFFFAISIMEDLTEFQCYNLAVEARQYITLWASIGFAYTTWKDKMFHTKDFPSYLPDQVLTWWVNHIVQFSKKDMIIVVYNLPWGLSNHAIIAVPLI